MGNQAGCCAAEGVQSGQQDLKEAVPAVGKESDKEEVVKAPRTSPEAAAPEPAAPAAAEAPASQGQCEWKITLVKTPNSNRLGVDVDLTDGTSLLIDKVNEGLVNDWNKANPDKEVRKDDRIVAVNGSRGNAQSLTEVCKKDDTLEMVVVRDGAQ